MFVKEFSSVGFLHHFFGYVFCCRVTEAISRRCTTCRINHIQGNVTRQESLQLIFTVVC